MSLVNLWINSREQLKDKHVQQIVAIAGDGQLRDGNATSLEFRDFISHIPSDLLGMNVHHCIADSFSGSGYALQDIVNQLGKRLGFEVEDGHYRGRAGQVGFDGLWRLPEGHSLIVEVKTTDAYRIDLETIATYRRELISKDKLVESTSSILLVVGREDTGGLEAQIRGSRHAWDIRLISVDALIDLVKLKEDIDDPETIRRIYALLIPREYTKLDEIIDLVFSTAEEIRVEEMPEDEDLEDEEKERIITPVSFNEACVSKIEKELSKSFVKRSRTTYSSPNQSIAVVCAVSKPYFRGGRNTYWFAFHQHQKEFIEQAEEGFVAFGCGTPNKLIVIPHQKFYGWLDGMHTTVDERRMYWHVHISQDNGDFHLNRKKGEDRINLSQYLYRGEEEK